MIRPAVGLTHGGTNWPRTLVPLGLFVTLGLPAGAVGVAWPHMRASLGAPLAGLGLLLAAVTIAYFAASGSSGPLAARFGGVPLLITGCACAAAGLIALSLATKWWMVPPLGLLVGAGSGLIDASVNAHVSLNRGVRYMGWLHASWAAGAALGPQVVLISLAASGSWRPAFAVAGAAFLLGGVAVAIRRPDWTGSPSTSVHASTDEGAPRTTFGGAMVLLAALFLLAAGLEASAGDWSYTQLTLGRAVTAALATWGATLFWTGLAGGRAGLGIVGHRFTPVRLLDLGIGLAVLASLTYWFAPPLVATFVALPLLGVAVSVVFPLLLSITPSLVGAGMTGHAVGYGLAAGTIGGGGLPAATGVILQSVGLLALGPLLTVMAAGLLILHLLSRREPRH